MQTLSKYIKGPKEHLFIMTQTNLQIFAGNPLCQATKRHLNDSWMVKNYEKWELK